VPWIGVNDAHGCGCHYKYQGQYFVVILHFIWVVYADPSRDLSSLDVEYGAEPTEKATSPFMHQTKGIFSIASG
jgi:hypothetical protein